MNIFLEIESVNYVTLYQHLQQQHETHVQKDCREYVKLILYYITK